MAPRQEDYILPPHRDALVKAYIASEMALIFIEDIVANRLPPQRLRYFALRRRHVRLHVFAFDF